MLFSGSLRFNIDPSESFTNEDVWRALEQSHLKSFVETLPDNIYHECGEDGKNLRSVLRFVGRIPSLELSCTVCE